MPGFPLGSRPSSQVHRPGTENKREATVVPIVEEGPKENLGTVRECRLGGWTAPCAGYSCWGCI